MVGSGWGLIRSQRAAVVLGLAALLLACVGTPATDRPAVVPEVQDDWSEALSGLRLRAFSPTPVYGDSGAFVLEVVFENVGPAPTVILPASLYRHYDPLGHGSVTYVPFPGPRLSPWRSAFVMTSGERRSVQFIGMRDGDGRWELAPGSHRLSVRYFVPEDLLPSLRANPDSLSFGDTPVWTGDFQSRAFMIEYTPRTSP